MTRPTACSPKVSIDLDEPLNQQAADAPHNGRTSFAQQLESVANLLLRTPKANSLHISMQGPGLRALEVPVLPQLPQVTAAKLGVEYGGVQQVLQLLAGLSTACPNLRKMDLHVKHLGRLWEPALAALPPSLHALGIDSGAAKAPQIASALAAAATHLTGLQSLSIRHKSWGGLGDARDLVPAVQQLTHLQLCNSWRNMPAVLAACGSTLRSFSLAYPLSNGPQLGELLQHTPQLQSLELIDKDNREDEPSCSEEDTQALATMQHLTQLILESDTLYLPLLTTPLPPGSLLQLQEVHVGDMISAAPLDQIFSSRRLAPGALLVLQSLQLHTPREPNIQLYMRLTAALRQYSISMCWQPGTPSLPETACLMLDRGVALESHEARQWVVGLLTVLRGVHLGDDLIVQLQHEVRAVHAGGLQAVQEAGLQAGGQAAAGPVWLLPAMAHITTLVLSANYDQDCLCLQALPALQAAGFLPSVRHVVLTSYFLNSPLTEVAHVLAASPQLTASFLRPLTCSQVEQARSQLSEFVPDAAAAQVLRDRLLC